MIQNCTREHVAEDSNSHFKCITLSKRQGIYILFVLLVGIGTGSTSIAGAIVAYRGGSMSKTFSVCLIVAGVALIIFGTLLAISSILYKRNKVLRRSLDLEKVRFYSTLIEQDRQRKWNNSENVKRDTDATISPDYKLDSHSGLLVDKPTSSLRDQSGCECDIHQFLE